MDEYGGPPLLTGTILSFFFLLSIAILSEAFAMAGPDERPTSEQRAVHHKGIQGGEGQTAFHVGTFFSRIEGWAAICKISMETVM